MKTPHQNHSRRPQRLASPKAVNGTTTCRTVRRDPPAASPVLGASSSPPLLLVVLAALAFGLFPGSRTWCAAADQPPTYYVNVANANPVYPYTNWAIAATNIQDAVEAGTGTGRLVLVTNGVYQTSTTLANGANRVRLADVVLRSVNGPEVTVIDGAGAARCAHLGANAILSGFTLQNGRAAGEDADHGGGVRSEASGVVTNCVLTGNRADNQGGGGYGGTLYNCTLTGNLADSGGGASGSTLINCTLTGNTARYGGGTRGSTLYNCTLTGNSAGEGGGADGGGLYNSIVYSNHAPSGANWLGATLEFSCTTPLPPGPGNISADPQLVSATHLSPTSPCLGSGSPTWASGVDIDGEPWAAPPAMGADQVWPGQSVGPLTLHIQPPLGAVAAGFPVAFTAHNTGPILRSVWDFGDGTVVTNQAFIRHAWTLPGTYTVRLTGYNDAHPEGVTAELQIEAVEGLQYVNAGNTTPRFPYTTWATAARTIQDALETYPAPGRVIWVTNGVYQTGIMEAYGTNRVALVNVELRSVNGPEVTIIDGANEVWCVYLGTNAVLCGFTLRNGRAGGDWPAGDGGGVWSEASGVVTNCVLNGNTAPDRGGGTYGGTLYDCTLTGNSAQGSWQAAGGGAYGGTLYNCALRGNSAVYGGGASDGTLYNCTLTGNSGGGAFGGVPYNCTLTGNSGGGVRGCMLRNCIVYHNQGGNWAYSTFEHSCSTPQPPGPGNILVDPQLASATRLSAASPCIRAGNPEWASGLDIDGESWADPPAMGADQVWTGQSEGPLTMHIEAPFTDVAAGFPVSFTAYNTGPIVQSVWDFGDGTVVTNQPFISHAWMVPGRYAVQLTGYNDAHPDGVNTRLQMDVIEVVHYANVANARPVFPYTSWATAATNIQDAVNAGTVTGRLNGPEVTIIDGSAAVRCVYLGTNAILSGFTLRNASGVAVFAVASGVVTNCVLTGNGGGAAGATLYSCTLTGNSGSGASGCTLYNCTLTGNAGSGASGCTLYNCRLTGNSAGRGGGASESTLYNCTLTGNSAQLGGGTYDSTLYNCTLTGNSAWNGGGVRGGTLYNCTLTGNSAERGGGAYDKVEMFGGGDCTLYNCTLTGNRAQKGGGVVGCSLYNCIVHFNEASEGANWAYDYRHFAGAAKSPPHFEYSCTTPLLPGTGNTDADPRLGSTTHLSVASPCIGAGNSAWTTRVDMDGEPWASPPAMGADQVWPGQSVGLLTLQTQTQFSEAAVDYPVSFTAHNTGSISLSVWDFGDGTSVTNHPFISHAWTAPGRYTVQLTGYNDTHPEGVTTSLEIEVIVAVHYVNVANATPVFPYTRWATAATNIQDAVNAGAVNGSLVLVTNGVYRVGMGETYELSNDGFWYSTWNRVALTNPVVVRSVNGPDVTVIEGSQSHPETGQGSDLRCAYVGEGAVLSGFTLRDGRAASDWDVSPRGGGVWGAASSVITNCILTGNSAGEGGGAYGGTLYDCTLTGNTGGGACDGTLYNCTLTRNSARIGGGAYDSTLYNCTLTANSAEWGGGAYGGTLYNCTLTGNSAERAGGGACGDYTLFRTLYNCTLTGNSARESGGGAAGCTLYNCIVYFNQAPKGPNWFAEDRQDWSPGSVELSCTTPLPPGIGNSEANPDFVNAEAGDFRLHYGSLCIDTGAALDPPLTHDLDGLPRPLDGNGDGLVVPDMGAYEFDLRTVVPPDWFAQHDLDASDPYVLCGNPDEDGQTSFQEWLAGTDPRDPLSFFRIEAMDAGPPVRLFYHSLNGRVYSLYGAAELAGEADGLTVWAPVPGQLTLPGSGRLDSLTDTNALPRSFYRVEVELP